MRATAHRQGLTGIVLAGGRASRMKGKDKAFLKIGQETLIKIQLRVLKKIFKKIIIVTNSLHLQRYRELKGIELVSDIISDSGPLAGIYSGLLASEDKYNFVVACDMPFLNGALIEHLINIRDNHDITIPKIDGKFHPLFGIYSKDCILIIEEMLTENRLNVSSIFTKVKSHFIIKEEIEKFDTDLSSLVNINTKRDLETVRKMKGVKVCRNRYPQR